MSKTRKPQEEEDEILMECPEIAQDLTADLFGNIDSLRLRKNVQS